MSGEVKLKQRERAVSHAAATAAFLLMGFVWNLWHPGWVVFPIGGILCGIVSSIRSARNASRANRDG